METQTESRQIEDWLKLLLAFRGLPATKSRRTFMEVSGYPHYENVASNILKFYLDPAAEHGLGDLVLAAFLRMAGAEIASPLRDVSVETQQGTEAGNSIDLIVSGDTFTIGIENKIFHWLANDLEDYGRYVDRRGFGKPVVIKAVLGLRRFSDPAGLKGGFISYTYSQLWGHVRPMLGQCLAQADPKRVSYLVDFIETTTNLAGENMELNQNDKFFIEHHELISSLISQRNAFIARLNQKVATLTTMMSETPEARLLCKAPWIYSGNGLILDFYFADSFGIAFDLYLGLLGWQLQLHGRTVRARNYLAKLITEGALRERAGDAPVENGRYIVQLWSIEADLGQIRDAMCGWIRAVVEAANAQRT